MNRKLIILLLLLAFSAPAIAETGRSMVWELRFGLYKPNIDSEFSGTTKPFQDIFGGSNHLIFQTELGYEVYKGVGSLSIAPGFGYSSVSGKGLLLSGEKSNDTTKLNIFPLYLSLVYRFDWLAIKYNVPIVPVVKGGFDYFFWWITNGLGNVASYTDANGHKTKARGGTFGAHVSFGIDFLLDWLAPGMAQDFDSDVGVNNTYIFAEYTMYFVNNFGKGNSFNLSDNKSVFFGMAFEF